jgi:NAD(P)-dependent dehydrogenase (short-subunit alcohol dehydrogenase family)
MDLGLRGKGAVVTGASRGIGRAIARRSTAFSTRRAPSLAESTSS